MHLLKAVLSHRFLLLAFLMALAVPQPVLACSCVGSPAAVKLDRSDFAFNGYLSGKPKVNIGGSVVYTFDQLEILKGSIRSSVDINFNSMDGNSCGYNFLPDVKYRVYATSRNGYLRSGLCSVSVESTGKEAIPFEDSLQRNNIEERLRTSNEIYSATEKLLQAGCTVIHQSTTLPNCFRENDASPLICKGQYTSVFNAIDGTYDQQDHLYEWNRRTDELRVTGFQGFLIMIEECKNGMDVDLRWKKNRENSK